MARRSMTRTSRRSSIISWRPTEIRFETGPPRARPRAGWRSCLRFSKSRPVRFYHPLAPANVAKPPKSTNGPRESGFPRKFRCRLSYQACPIPRIVRASGMAGLRGPAVRYCFCSRGDDVMAKGTVKWFNPTKGFGFIQPSSGGKDVFVHISAVEKAGLSTLNEGQTVEYEEVANRGKTSAENLKV